MCSGECLAGDVIACQVEVERKKCMSIPGHEFIDIDGKCECRCVNEGSVYETLGVEHPYVNLPLSEAASKCSEAGGLVNSTDKCQCGCMYGNQSTHYIFKAAEKECREETAC